MSAPLIETEQGSEHGASDSSTDVAGAVAGGGPTIVLRFSDGSEVTLEGDDLLVMLAAIQTLLLLYVTWKEATS